ncbi:MAG: hypothetical protein EBZ17_09385 [Actinobacteria bacterium]|nr:hypothetical protein [Actinomycetota bacterium]
MVVATLVPSSSIANGSSVARVTGRRPRDGSPADQGRTNLVSARDRELTPSGYASDSGIDSIATAPFGCSARRSRWVGVADQG